MKFSISINKYFVEVEMLLLSNFEYFIFTCYYGIQFMSSNDHKQKNLLRSLIYQLNNVLRCMETMRNGFLSLIISVLLRRICFLPCQFNKEYLEFFNTVDTKSLTCKYTLLNIFIWKQHYCGMCMLVVATSRVSWVK